MKKTIKLLPMLLLFLCFLITPSQVFAAMAEAGSIIDFNSISVTFENTGVSDYSIETYAEGELNLSFINDSDTGSSSDIVEAYIEYDPNAFYAYGLYENPLLQSYSLIDGYSGYAYSEAFLYGTYTAAAQGTLSISFNYMRNYSITTNTGEHAQIFTGTFIELFDPDYPDDPPIAYSYQEIGSRRTGSYSESSYRPESFEILLSENETIDFYAGVYSEVYVSSVPVPNTVLLLSSGIIALLGFRKRIKE